MPLGWLAFLVLLLMPGCISKGDTVVSDNSDGTTRPGGSLCEQYCGKLEEDCGLQEANCVADCQQRATDCEGAFDIYYECFLANPLRCRSTAAMTSAATCDDEAVAAQECADLRDDNGAGASDGACPMTCGSDELCAGIDDEYVCAARCDNDAECVSGCCAPVGDESACGPPRFCAPVGLGNPCNEDSDCDEDAVCDSVNFFCTTLCQEDAECGTNVRGLPNACIFFGEDDGDGLCTPTCTDEGDCEGYVLLDGCVQGEPHDYCL